MRIRPATEADWPEVHRMAALLALDAAAPPEVHEQQFGRTLTDERSIALVASTGASCHAYALGGCLPMPLYGGGLAMLQELYVDDTYRRSGIAKTLVDAFSTWAHRQGATIIALATSRDGARAFYEAQGFVTRPTTYYWRRLE